MYIRWKYLSKKSITVLCIAIFIVILVGCGKNTNNMNFSEDRNKKWIEDIDYIAQELPKNHANLFFKLSNKEFEKEINKVKKEVHKLDDNKIKVKLMKIVASIGDAHTSLNFGTTEIYPVGVYWINDGVYVRNTIPEYKEILDCKVVKVNGKNIDKVIKEIRKVISHENEQWVKSRLHDYFYRPEILYGLNLAKDTKTINLTLENRDGTRFDKIINSVDSRSIPVLARETKEDELPWYRRYIDKYYWFQYLQDSKTIYFKYDQCMDMNEKTMSDFTTELMKFIDSHTVDKLVVDMRNNKDGDSELLSTFITGIKNRPKINQKDHLFVIIGRDTFSSGVLNSIQMKNETNALLLGEPTGGKPNCYGNIRYFNTPNNQLDISYSTKYYKSMKEDMPSLEPDIEIELSLQDYIDNRDPILEKILQIP